MKWPLDAETWAELNNIALVGGVVLTLLSLIALAVIVRREK